MKMEAPGAGTTDQQLSRAQMLLRTALSGLDAYANSLSDLRKAIRIAANLGKESEHKAAMRLMARLDAFEPSVTMIGQIKSGKTTLVNCMIGCPDLLPADVNPWTSVVTSLHLNPAPMTPPATAKFQFFEEDEWDRLIAGGGRIGELADRAGADDELAKIKAQVTQMREKSKARLGRKFEALLGQVHDYGYFDKELIERYVCLGDEFDDAASDDQGRFADITKSAALNFYQPASPMKLCVRDTPGVNDTFLMREQITIRSIRDSRICVVVLSAHQALSSTDLALVRLISNVKSRDVIIFINRIDELSDPAAQVPHIRESVRETLGKQGCPDNIQLIFGSALWAHSAMSEAALALPDASRDALINWAKVSADPELRKKKARVILWELSGLPELYGAIAERVADGIGREAVGKLLPAARNLVNGIQLGDNLADKARIGAVEVHQSPDQMAARLEALRQDAEGQLEQELASVFNDFGARIERVHDSFLSRATQTLIQHLERYGEGEVWEYDPSGLRMLLSSSYSAFGKKSQGVHDRVLAQLAQQFRALYQDGLQLPETLFDIEVPPAPRVPPPVTLGQTMALDLKGGWWKSWWFRRRGYQKYAADFHEMIRGETVTLLSDIRNNQAVSFHATLKQQVDEFIEDQSEALLKLVQGASLSTSSIDDLFDRPTLERRDGELRRAHDLLDRYET